MFDKPVLYLLTKITAVLSITIIHYTANVDITRLVISTLSFICVFLLEFLIDKLYHKQKFVILLVLSTIAACLILDMDVFFPIYLILVIHLIDILIHTKMFYHILVVVVLLSFFIFNPGKLALCLSLIYLLLVLFGRALFIKLAEYKTIIDEQKDIISELHKKMSDLKCLTKTMKHKVSMEERNRIAARIHDQIGHGVSGSIIMLEAAMMIIKDNPEKAVASVNKAIGNLRGGVDEIRAALKEERTGRYLFGLKDVTTMLEEFNGSYNKTAKLKKTGDLDFVSIEVWSCIHDNLKECLTNVLKHSNATEFILSIEVFKKIIKVEYKDNGKSSDNFEKGLGLEAIEERTVNVNGRCFFHKGENGFSITNIFTY